MKNWLKFIIIGSVGLIIGVIIGTIVTFLVLNNKTKTALLPDKSIRLYPFKYSESGNNWIVKIDDYVITRDEFETGYKIFQKQAAEYNKGELPDEKLLKRQYFNNLLDQFVMSIKALNDGMVNNKETELLIQYSLRDTISRIYINKFFPTDPSKFTPTKIEIDQFIRQYKNQLEQSGLPQSRIIEYVRQQLYQSKVQYWYQDFVKQTKDQFKIERNNEYLIKNGIMEPIQNLPNINLSK